ncbi:MAG: insulinase family protein, partial [Myxococcales bacterium]|nr:insulinase family protein [Myxococcales bacterium]
MVAALLVSLTAVPSCGPIRTVRYGSLTGMSARRFDFSHDIQLFATKNGMKLALIPDGGTNLVSVDMRYQVGAAEDPAGRAGMAHLLEHVTFLSRATADGPTIADRLGETALAYNAWTNWDETHYTETALDDQLDALLAIEAERMQLSCDAVDDAVFERERDVVLQEEAERGASPLLLELDGAMFGKDTPLAHPVGSHEIGDAGRAEACAFHGAYYAPDRAILVISGHFDVDQTMRKIGALFGPIERQAARPRAALPAPALDGATSHHHGSVRHPLAVVAFPEPAWGGDDQIVASVYGQLLEGALADADHEAAWILDSGVGQLGSWRDRVGVAYVEVEDPARFDDAVAAIRKAMTRLTRGGGNKRFDLALDLARWEQMATYAATYDDTVARGPWVADYLQYTDDNMFMLREMAELYSLKSTSVATYAEKIAKPDTQHVMLVEADGTDGRLVVAPPSREHDLQLWRAPVDPGEATRPIAQGRTRVQAPVTRYDLDNGLHVVLSPDLASPIVDARLIYPVGNAADPAARPGLASLAASLFDHSYSREYDPSDRRMFAWVLSLGAQESASVTETTTTFRSMGLATFADWHVWRLFWLMGYGEYDRSDLAALRKRLADTRDAELATANRLLLEHLFGADHPYARSRTDLAATRKITVDELQAFRAAHYLPNGATLVVTGKFDLAKMKQEIQELFGGWRDTAPAAVAAVAPPTLPAHAAWLGVRNRAEDDDAAQAGLTVAFATASRPHEDRAARLILADILQDRARVVREGQGTSYGVS